MYRYLQILTVVITIALPCFALSQELAVKPAAATYRVDFINVETRSVSVPVGLKDGITTDMNYALLSESGEVFAEIYPFEILSGRFWSAPLEKKAFERMMIGMGVIRIKLPPEKARKLRSDSAARATALKGALLRAKRERLRYALNELDEEIAILEFRRDKFRRELTRELSKERGELQLRVSRINDDLDQNRYDLDDLVDERNELIDEREDLRRRSNPPQNRIGRINNDIAELNENIDELRDKIRDLRKKRRDYTQEAQRRGILDLVEQLEEISINADRFYLDIEDLKEERIQIISELNKLEVELYR
ncbi:MAG: hypothetical protein V3S63_02335 [bacterium]